MALSQVEDALGDAMDNPSNGLSERSREAKVIRRTLAKYGNDPQRIEMDLVSVHGAITRQIVSEELPASEENLALLSACEEGAQGIRATHPEIAKNRRILQEQVWREMPETAKAQVENALPVLEAMSEEPLADDFRDDIPRLFNDAIGPVPGNAPPLGPADARIRVFSRVSKMTLVLRSSLEILDRTCAATGLSRGDVVQILIGIVGIGISLL